MVKETGYCQIGREVDHVPFWVVNLKEDGDIEFAIPAGGKLTLKPSEAIGFLLASLRVVNGAVKELEDISFPLVSVSDSIKYETKNQ